MGIFFCMREYASPIRYTQPNKSGVCCTNVMYVMPTTWARWSLWSE
ncbi:hypothetical protein [uncultured Dubosiella sp.]|nr:hypothetical protein [uncultured Dubosiella sp.]